MLRRGSIATLLAVMLVACVAPQRSFVRDVVGGTWSKAVEVTFDNEDTVSLRRLSVVVRYNSRFAAASLPVVMRVTAPDARYFDDSVMLYFTRPYTAASVSAAEVIPYREHSRLSLSGRYTFRITPTCAASGIEAVGVEIDNE